MILCFIDTERCIGSDLLGKLDTVGFLRDVQVQRLFSNLSLWPPSLSKGRGSICKRGVKPLPINLFPPPLKERGIKGVRLINTLKYTQLTFPAIPMVK